VAAFGLWSGSSYFAVTLCVFIAAGPITKLSSTLDFGKYSIHTGPKTTPGQSHEPAKSLTASCDGKGWVARPVKELTGILRRRWPVGPWPSPVGTAGLRKR